MQIKSLVRITTGKFKGHLARVVSDATQGGQITVKLIGESRRRDFFNYELTQVGSES